MDTAQFLKPTDLLNFHHPSLERLAAERNWDSLDTYERIGAVYDFVKDEILFGYNEADSIPASHVLRDGNGQCNTKSILLMALLRRVGVPCRIHGFAIDRQVQKGAIPGIIYKLTPQTLLHTWVEILYQGQWLHLEGCILDPGYLSGVQAEHQGTQGAMCGFGIATEDLHNPPVQWQGADTSIQKDAIVADYGLFDAPDDLYRERGANLDGSVMKQFLYKHCIRRMMNARVARIRNGQPANA